MPGSATGGFFPASALARMLVLSCMLCGHQSVAFAVRGCAMGLRRTLFSPHPSACSVSLDDHHRPRSKWVSTVAAAGFTALDDGDKNAAAASPTPPLLKKVAAATAPKKKTKNSSSITTSTTATVTTKSTPNKTAKSQKIRPPPFQPHPLWREQLEHIRAMRADGPAAPVDLFGCSELGKRHATSPAHMRFQTLVSSMLSSQTTDLVNEKAMGRLFDACGITIEGLEALGEEGIVNAIKPVSFYTAKAANILKVCAILKTQYAGDIPRTFEELMLLPGVGPKMATLVCAYGWGEVVGICVDTHVHRISNRLGWANTWNYKKPKAQNPEKTRKLLESWMPRENWEEVNPLLVGLGQQTCRAINPKCWECKLTAICPSYLPPA